jgi:hypothetical protein
MLEGCVGPIAGVGARLVFLFATAAAVTSRRGILLIVNRRGVLMAAIRQRSGEHMDCRLGRGL